MATPSDQSTSFRHQCLPPVKPRAPVRRIEEHYQAVRSKAVQWGNTHKPVSNQMSWPTSVGQHSCWKEPICTFTATNAGGDWAGKEGATPAFPLTQSHCSRCAWGAAPGSSFHKEGESSTTSNGCTRLSNRKSPSSFSYVHF